MQVTEAAASSTGHLPTVALLDATDFGNGTIEVLVAGMPAPLADTGARGFVGLSFRVDADASHSEDIFLRPTNGRTNDQLRRNHAAQYESIPDYPWYRLRKETPGRYEAYVDLEPGVWTKMRIVVDGVRASLFVNDAPQPCLIVTDLKLGETHGRIGLWIGSGTVAYFSHLSISRTAARRAQS